MIMPGRMFTALTVSGGSVSGTTQVNGFTVPVDLALTSRNGNEPTQYTASRSIDLDEGFESGTDDDVTAYLTDTSYAGTGNGADVVAGASKYRYGFGGQEKSDEIKGAGNSYTAEFWEYDPRVGRRWNTDPKPTVGMSPYSAFKGNPILNIDPLGDTTGDPIMPRHPIENPSDAGYLLYNIIGTVVNGVQSIVGKAGDYGGALTSGTPLQSTSAQATNDVNAIKGIFVSQYKYFSLTPKDKLVSDAKDYFSHPDNYFNAAENAFGIIATGKFTTGSNAAFSKINIAENFSLKSASVDAAVADGSYYSVAYETKLPSNLYPGKGYYTHFKAANEALHAAIQADPIFASSIQELGITIPRSATGSILGKSPVNWVWHHDIKVGVMQLTLKAQHTTKSIFWDTMHPNGVGGMHLWGK